MVVAGRPIQFPSAVTSMSKPDDGQVGMRRAKASAPSGTTTVASAGMLSVSPASWRLVIVMVVVGCPEESGGCVEEDDDP